MVIRYENVWVGLPLLLIPIGFVLLMMALIKVWMVGVPVKERKIPEYSLHVMYEPPSKQLQRALYGETYSTKNRKEPQAYNAVYGKKPADPYSSIPFGYRQAQERAGTPTQYHDVSYGSMGAMLDKTDTSVAYAEKSRII